MKIPSLRLPFLGALCALALTFGTATTSSAQNAAFFNGATVVGTDANGFLVENVANFNNFSRDLFPYVYKYGFGYVYYFADTSSATGAYFYDYTSTHFLYTSTSLYPYFYDFSLNSYLYYFEGSSPRTFYRFSNSTYVQQ